MTLLFSRASQCDGKVCYPNKATARKAARRQETAEVGGRVDVYRCQWCNSFHKGHRPPRQVLDFQRIDDAAE